MKWNDVTLACHGCPATVRFVLPIEQGLSAARQRDALTVVDTLDGIIDFPTHGSISPVLKVGFPPGHSSHTFSPEAIVILR